jgi:phage terminase large subunit GpA-like protein
MNKIVDAMWSVHLFVTCPHCGEYFDLLDTPNFW